MEGMRKEKDSLGQVLVANSALWGAQTQRSLENFSAGEEAFPLDLIYAITWIKRACAKVHGDLGLIASSHVEAIIAACDRVLEGHHDDQFPLKVWQTGSGTQTHMNVNEVLANIASETMGGKRGEKAPIHPNDHLNMGQSSNDVFPSAMHVALALQLENQLFPALANLQKALMLKADQCADLIKTGRTHLMDAAPLPYKEVFLAFSSQIDLVQEQLAVAKQQILALALGGSAVGTGLNCHKELSQRACDYLSQWLDLPFYPAKNFYSALSAHEADLALSAAHRNCATILFKLANDLRFLASGPRCGLAELNLPENEPGSSIMPGKVNPTQCEALCMMMLQVMGMDSSIGMAGSQGNFELNVFKPLIFHNCYKSSQLLSQGIMQFIDRCLKALTVNESRVEHYLDQSLMRATSLNAKLGYDQVSKLVRKAHTTGKTLKEVVLEEGALTVEEFEKLTDPKKMV